MSKFGDDIQRGLEVNFALYATVLSLRFSLMHIYSSDEKQFKEIIEQVVDLWTQKKKQEFEVELSKYSKVKRGDVNEKPGPDAWFKGINIQSMQDEEDLRMEFINVLKKFSDGMKAALAFNPPK